MLQKDQSPSRLEQLVHVASAGRRPEADSGGADPRALVDARARIQSLEASLQRTQAREQQYRQEVVELRGRLVKLNDRLRAARQREDKRRAEVVELRTQLAKKSTTLAIADDRQPNEPSPNDELSTALAELEATRRSQQTTALRLSRLQSSKLGKLQMTVWRLRRR